MQSTSSSRAKSSHSSIARSGSLSRTSRGVSSCSAAVRTLIFMNLGSNCFTAMGLLLVTNQANRQSAANRVDRNGATTFCDRVDAVKGEADLPLVSGIHGYGQDNPS